MIIHKHNNNNYNNNKIKLKGTYRNSMISDVRTKEVRIFNFVNKSVGSTSQPVPHFFADLQTSPLDPSRIVIPMTYA